MPKWVKSSYYDNSLDDIWQSTLRTYRSVDAMNDEFRRTISRSFSRNFDLQPKRSFQNLKGFVERKLSSQSLRSSSTQEDEHFTKYASLPYVFPIARPVRKDLPRTEIPVFDSGYFDASESSTCSLPSISSIPSIPSTSFDEERRIASLDCITDAKCSVELTLYPPEPTELHIKRKQVFRGIRAAKNARHIDPIPLTPAARIEKVNAIMHTMIHYQKYSTAHVAFPCTANAIKHVQQDGAEADISLAAQVRSILGGTLDQVDEELERESVQQSIIYPVWQKEIKDIQIAC
ncbi:hypothetical protein INT43_006806 [Umbelopsis isabellina]|uniref:Uncharacterized protein n=1 Tax=Mortierella isabellina TaxID=91625 RepID=A0A8H7Q1X2_MORIS|nr:hypothetical protein INT43_006806 [Umbelopsis isabellina]